LASIRGRSFGRLFRGMVIALLVAGIGLVVVVLIPERPFSQEAREAVLRTNLEVLRESIAEYHEDHGRGPQSLRALVAAGYLRQLPVDPMSGNSTTWDVEMADDGTIRGVHSASEEAALDGSHYRDW
jgi:general secretion pathway protein G